MIAVALFSRPNSARRWAARRRSPSDQSSAAGKGSASTPQMRDSAAATASRLAMTWPSQRPSEERPSAESVGCRVGEIVASKGQIARQVHGGRPVGGKLDRGAPALQQTLGFAPDVFAHPQDRLERLAGGRRRGSNRGRRGGRLRKRVRWGRRTVRHGRSPRHSILALSRLDVAPIAAMATRRAGGQSRRPERDDPFHLRRGETSLTSVKKASTPAL